MMFRRLVVIGLVVSLGSLGLGCGTSYPKYGEAHGRECDLPNAPSDKLYTRGVQTETSGIGNAYREFRWSDPNADVDRRISAAEWTRFEMDDDTAFEACQQRYLDKASTKATPTTKARIATTSTKAVRKYSSSDPEYKLAAIDKSTQYPSDSVIAPYARVLDALRGKCNEGGTKLGDMAVVAQGMFEDIGEQLSLLEILRLVDRSIPADWPGKMNCVQIYASLVILSS